jgi:hypothetical protein
MFKTNDPIAFRDPKGDGVARGTFQEVAVGQPEPRPDGSMDDTAWVRYSEGELEGTTARVRFSDIRADDGRKAAVEGG